MIKLLLRLFVKDHENTGDIAVRSRYGMLSGWVGIVANALLFLGKFIIGTVSGSLSIVGDAVNNLSDASSSLVTIIGFKLAAKPADDKHPYGYSRIEYFSGLFVAFLILVIGFELAKSSVQKIITPTTVEFSCVLVIVLVMSIAIKLWLFLFNRRLGKAINSHALIATADDNRNDCVSTFAILLSCIIGKIFNIRIDGYMGLAVALFILWSGIKIVKDTVSSLLGEAPDEELVHSLAAEICKGEQVLGIHDLIMHDYGPGRRFASVHIEMDYKLDPLIAHEIIDNIERHIMEVMSIELVVHYDPIVTDDEETNAMKKSVLAAINGIDERFNIHDFRMVKGSGHTNVIFDLVIPREYDKRKSELEQRISESIQFGDKKYYAVITFDTESFNDPHTVI